MARRPVNAKNQLGALPLALTCTALYIVLAGTAGYLTSTRPPPTAAALLPTITTTTTQPTTTQPTTNAPTTTQPTTTTTLPPDLQRVEAPGGLTTAIPANWTVTTGTVATTLVATDPTSPRRELRLGGAPVTDPATPLLDRITRAAADREREPGHRRVTLTATTIRDHPAVTWEFDENTPSGPKRVATAFWESAGVEYVLYSAGPPEEWDLTRSRLSSMVDRSTP
ncbi:hypothetical protein [Saccharothrix sp. NRRL B-16348]|uniref:hypothetical protein n=1 Tax=Saccharothrix sp. NRRL B-16348 TaxID=1415542 RepID=UPI0012F97D9C|nr:hypothetical protein [Saccharothrix sp. NRRL B-16348]